jgi:hypothetical protein
MAVYRAEDISVGIDDQEFPAINLSFQSSNTLEENRRLGANPAGNAFSTSGPQRSSISFDFYLTGNCNLTGGGNYPGWILL